MQHTRVLVVTMSVSFEESNAPEGYPKVFAAREDHIGIRGYGATREQAQARLEKVLGEQLSQLALKGILEKKLDSAGIQWRWASAGEEHPVINPTVTIWDSEGNLVATTDMNWGRITEAPLVTDSHILIPAA